MRFAPWGWAGPALVAAAWPLNWAVAGLRTHLLFFPLWPAGYIGYLPFSLELFALYHFVEGLSGDAQGKPYVLPIQGVAGADYP